VGQKQIVGTKIMKSILTILSIILIFPILVNANSNSPPFPPEMQKLIDSRIKEMHEKGFVETHNNYPRKLMSMSYKKITFSKSDSIENSDLEKNSNKIPLSFIFKDKIKHVIAYAPIGLWIGKGWSGIKEFFVYTDIGTCDLSTYNFSITHGSVNVPENIRRNDINGKTTAIYVEGNYSDGFMYSIRWNDDKYFYDLSCANMNFNENIKNRMIELAKKIDKE
jgi:hypothetical protein